MQLLISNEQKEAAIGEELCSLIQDALEEVLTSEPGSPCSWAIGDREAEVSLALVDDARMAALNQRYRGLAGTTDVLSFPMISDVRGKKSEVGKRQKQKSEANEEGSEASGHPPGGAERTPADLRGQRQEVRGQKKTKSGKSQILASDFLLPTSEVELLLGDIVISVPRALNQAADYGNSFPQEMVFLAVHGMLHLLGYDDETDPGAARMMERARQVMDKLGLGAGGDV